MTPATLAAASADPKSGTAANLPSECPPELTVLYDGSCPLCRREIGIYKGMKAAQALGFQDVSDPALALPAGTQAASLMARFHVQHADGRLESGARAFITLWALLPGWRWLARLGSLPGMAHLMEWAYVAFLRVRPAMQFVARHCERPTTRTALPELPHELLRELRTDHAGETGAVMIYRGVLAMARDPALREFAHHHLATEQRHLALIEQVTPGRERSWLLPLWRLSGWLTGAVPGLFGPRAVYATIQSVETFVDHHYADQVRLIDELLQGRHPAERPAAGPATSTETELQNLRALIEQCRLDEVSHRDDAAQRWDGRASLMLRLWQGAVGRGSAWAVSVCRRI